MWCCHMHSSSAELLKATKKIFAPLAEPNICVNHVLIFSKNTVWIMTWQYGKYHMWHSWPPLLPLKNPIYAPGCSQSFSKLLWGNTKEAHLYLNRLYTTVTVKCCTLVSPITVALFTGPSLSSEHVMDSLSSRDGDRYLGEGFIRESESSDSETDDGTGGEKNKDKGVSFKVDEWIALSGNQEVANTAIAQIRLLLSLLYFYLLYNCLWI